MKSFRVKKSKEQLQKIELRENEYLEGIQDFFTQLSNVSNTQNVVLESIESPEVLSELSEIVEYKEPDVPVSVVEVVAKSIKESVFELPDTPKVPKDVEILSKKITDLQNWITKIAMTGPGSGETRLLFLDDVNRSTVADGRWLKYDGASKKLIFDEINPYEVIHNTTAVTTNTYTLQDNDYYIGVNNPNSTTITLTSASSGRMVIIKDESGNASTNPITVVGTVDNDAGGFVIQLDNGAVQLIYRNGWRII